MDEIKPEPAQDTGAFCIEIKFNPDGTIKVGVEELKPDEEGGEIGNYQTVPDMQAALALVQELYESGGKPVADPSQSMEEGYQ